MAATRARVVTSMASSRRSSAARRLGILHDVAAVALDRPLHGLDPEQHVLARGIGLVRGQRARQIGEPCRRRETLEPSSGRSGSRLERRGKIVERIRRARCERDEAACVGRRATPASASRASVERVAHAARDRRRTGEAAAPCRAGIGERDQMAGQVAAVDRGDVGRIERPQVGRVVPVEEVAAVPLQRPIVASVASSRSTASSVPIQPKSRAATVDSSRGRYWSATSGGRRPAAGSSWKLSGGSMLSPAVTNVSKNRQVRRAISRSAAGIGLARSPGCRHRGATLTQRATAGESSQAQDEAAAATGSAARPSCQTATAASDAIRTSAPGHLAGRSRPDRVAPARWTGRRCVHSSRWRRLTNSR